MQKIPISNMESEINSLKMNKTYILTLLLAGKTLVGSQWVYTNKNNKNGDEQCKAWFVAKGYSKKPGILLL